MTRSKNERKSLVERSGEEESRRCGQEYVATIMYEAREAMTHFFKEAREESIARSRALEQADVL